MRKACGSSGKFVWLAVNYRRSLSIRFHTASRCWNSDEAVFNELEKPINVQSRWAFDKSPHHFSEWWWHSDRSYSYAPRCIFHQKRGGKKGLEIIHIHTFFHSHNNRVPCEFIHHPTTTIWTEETHFFWLALCYHHEWFYFLWAFLIVVSRFIILASSCTNTLIRKWN